MSMSYDELMQKGMALAEERLNKIDFRADDAAYDVLVLVGHLCGEILLLQEQRDTVFELLKHATP
jgi:hypothetical protein